MSADKDWIVLSAKPSARSGLHVHVRNLSDNGRDCHWEIGWESIDSERYDWSDCEYSEGAQVRLSQLQALCNANRSGGC